MKGGNISPLGVGRTAAQVCPADWKDGWQCLQFLNLNLGLIAFPMT